MKRIKLSIASLAAVVLVSMSVGAAFATTFDDTATYTTIKGTDLFAGHVGKTNETANEECKGDEDLDAGEVLWHFVLVQTTDAKTQSLRAKFANAGVTVPDVGSTKFVGGVIHWNVTTSGPDTLLAASTDALGARLNLSHVCNGDNKSAVSTLVTELHKGATDGATPDVIAVNTSVPLGSTVHDSAALSSTPDVTLPTGSSITFYFYHDLTCDGSFEGDPGASDAGPDVHDIGDQSANGLTVDPSFAQGPLPAGNYSYRAFFHSGDTDVILDATADCEPFTVDKGTTSSATEIHNQAGDVALVGTHVPLGTSVHDKATVTGTPAAFAPTGDVEFTFYRGDFCNGTPESAGTVALTAAGVAHPSDTFGPLGAGTYAFSAHYVGDDNYTESWSACEPLTVDKGTLTIRTDIHNAAHGVVLGVAPGAIVHDTATLSGANVNFDPNLGNVSFSFSMNGTCTDGFAIANGTPESKYVARSVDSAPLGSGQYSYSATFTGDANYNAVGPATCEPLAVRQLGLTMGFWGNKNGVARIIAAGGYATNAVNIGRGANVDTQTESKKILPSSLNACGKGTPFIFTVGAQTASAACKVATGINANSLNTLSAQTLALGYNIKLVSGYNGQTLGALSCAGTGTTLTGTSTVQQAFDAAKALIDGSSTGGATTQAQIGAMNQVLGCLNREA